MLTNFVFCLHLAATFSSVYGDGKFNFSCNDLHILFDESKHFINLRRIYDNLLRQSDVTLSENEVGFEFFKSKPLEFNVSEQFMRADIYTQTASLFYDHVNVDDINADVPGLFQNYSHCFLGSKNEKSANNTREQYRSIDGSNNNLKRPSMGASLTSFARLQKPQYDDQIHSIRKSIRGYKLPSPRNIVRKLFLNDEVNLNKFKNRTRIPNLAAVMFGQYIAHDVSLRQTNQYIDGGNGIRCCAHFNKIQLPASLTNSACLPITVSRSDPVYSPHNIKCLDFVRSNLISNHPGKLEVGEQVNRVTSFIDHSTIYGSDYATNKRVRSFNGGRLRTNIRNVLPFENGAYYSGDDRVNLTPFLAIWHSLFIRNHNQLADKLAVLNRQWDDERLFQEARKINTAVHQNIVYNEWLPLFIGQNASRQLNDIEYDESVEAATLNEFSAGGFRLMHSFISSQFQMFDDKVTIVKSQNFSDAIMKSKMLENSYDNVLRGQLKQKMNLVGYASEVLNKLFKNRNGIGLDLLSIDILRGRDHGIPAYYKFRKMCNLKANIKVFNDLAPHISSSAIIQLRQTYKSVFDIDLLVGGALENIASIKNQTADEAGFFGPTFQCIIAEQFRRLKAGDSYFFTRRGEFTQEQLQVVRSYSMAHLLCENSDVESVPRKAFLSGSRASDSVKCDKMSFMDLSLWHETVPENQ